MADEIRFVDAQEAQQIDDGGNRRLADAHRADVRRLDDRNRAAGAGQRARQDTGSHPTGSAPADDGDPPDAPLGS